MQPVSRARSALELRKCAGLIPVPPVLPHILPTGTAPFIRTSGPQIRRILGQPTMTPPRGGQDLSFGWRIARYAIAVDPVASQCSVFRGLKVSGHGCLTYLNCVMSFYPVLGSPCNLFDEAPYKLPPLLSDPNLQLCGFHLCCQVPVRKVYA